MAHVECPGEKAWAVRVESGELGAALGGHLERCPACRELVAELRADHAALEEVRALGGLRAVPADAPAGLPPVPGYEVEGELHRGGQGIVYRARHLATRRAVALKVMLDGAFSSAEKLRRFEREIELAAGLRHSGIVTVYDSGTSADGRAYYAMELVDGQPLDGFVAARADWRLEELLCLFLRIGAAVQHAHQHGVIHRDLKPANVLVDRGGEPRVLDFGLAKAFLADSGEEAELSRSGWFLGTLAYAAPEQVRGDRAAIDVRTDVYALGVLLYELLTGTRPAGDTTDVRALATAILEVDPEPPSRRRRRSSPRGPGLVIPADLDVIVGHALAKDPSRRYQSVGELLRDVERCLAGEPIGARRDSTWYLLAKIVRRHRIPAAAAALLFAVCLAAAIVSTAFWRRAERQTRALAAEVAKFTAVSGLMEDMLTSVRPDRAKGREVLVREILDTARAGFGDALAKEPLAAAAFGRTLGRSYLALALYDDAERELARALELRQNHAAAETLAAAECQIDLGEVDLAREDFAAAEAWFTAGEQAVRARAPLDGALLARALKGRAMVRYHRAEEDEAARLMEEGLAALDREGAAELAAESTTELGRFHAGRGALDPAETALRHALERWQALGERERLGRGDALALLGAVERRMGRPADALPRLEEAAAVVAKLLGEEHVRTVLVRALVLEIRAELEGWASVETPAREILAHAEDLLAAGGLEAAAGLNALAKLAEAAGDFPRARDLFRGALASYEALAPDHPWAILCRDSLAWQLYQGGEIAEAQPLARAALAAYRATGRRDLVLARIMNHAAWVVGSGPGRDREESLALARESRDLFAELHATPHPDLADATFTLGFFLQQAGELDEAEPLLEEALALRRELLGDEHVDVARGLYALGALRLSRGDLEAAEALQRECLDLRRRIFGASHPEVSSSLGTMARVRRARGDAAEAGRLLDEAIEMRGAFFAPDNLRMLDLYIERARLRGERGELTGWREDLARVLAIQRQSYGDADPRTRKTLEQLVELCVELGDPAAEQEYRALLSGADGSAGDR
ncbi:MAG: serine/threonine-protein kinase [Planctomycetota bacterium]